jgi:hypothetical protein
VQQHEVVDDVAEVRVLDAIAWKHDDEGAIPVGIDVGRRVAEPINVIGHIRKEPVVDGRRVETLKTA